MVNINELDPELLKKAKKVKLLVTDCDGVLTDGGVYFSAHGEEMKRFSIRDGMGVERLRKEADVDVSIVTGEVSESVKRRAEKLKISKLYLGIKKKTIVFDEIAHSCNITYDEIAYIGDDTNDIEVMKQAGICACPGDATIFAKQVADYVCEASGGNGAFREFAELIITAKKL